MKMVNEDGEYTEWKERQIKTCSSLVIFFVRSSDECCSKNYVASNDVICAGVSLNRLKISISFILL